MTVIVREGPPFKVVRPELRSRVDFPVVRNVLVIIYLRVTDTQVYRVVFEKGGDGMTRKETSLDVEENNN